MYDSGESFHSWLALGDGGSSTVKRISHGGTNAFTGDLYTYRGLLLEFRRSEKDNYWRNAQYAAELILELLDNGQSSLNGGGIPAAPGSMPASMPPPLGPSAGNDVEGTSMSDARSSEEESTVATLAADGNEELNKLQVTAAMVNETLRGEVAWLYPLLLKTPSREQVALFWLWQRFRCLFHATTSPRLLDEIDEAFGFELQLWRISCTEAAAPVINALAGCMGEEDEAAGFGTSDDSDSESADEDLPAGEALGDASQNYSALVTGVDCLGDLLEVQALPWTVLLGWLRLLVLVRLNRIGDALAYLELLQWRIDTAHPVLPDATLFTRLSLMCRAMKVKFDLAAGLPRNDLVDGILALSTAACAAGPTTNTEGPMVLSCSSWPSLVTEVLEITLHVGLLSALEEKPVTIALSARAWTSLAANASLDEGRVAEAGALAGDLMKLSPPQWREVAVWLECLSLSGGNNRRILEQAAVSLTKNWPTRAEGRFAKVLCLPYVPSSLDEAIRTLNQCLEDHALLLTAPAEHPSSLSNWLHLKLILLVWVHAWQWYFGELSEAAATAKALLYQFPHSVWTQIVQAQHRLLGVFSENRSPDDFLMADETAIIAPNEPSTPPPPGSGGLSAATSPATLAGFGIASCVPAAAKRTLALCEIIGDVGIFAGRLDVAVSYYRDAVQRCGPGSCMDRFELPLRHLLAEADLPELHLFGVRKAIVAVKLLHAAQDLQLQRAVRLARSVLERDISPEVKSLLLRIATDTPSTTVTAYPAPSGPAAVPHAAAVWFGISSRTVPPASMLHYISTMSATIRELFAKDA